MSTIVPQEWEVVSNEMEIKAEKEKEIREKLKSIQQTIRGDVKMVGRIDDMKFVQFH